MLGIELTDKDVFNIPRLIRTDLYGEFVQRANGHAPRSLSALGPDGIPNADDDVLVKRQSRRSDHIASLRRAGIGG